MYSEQQTCHNSRLLKHNHLVNFKNRKLINKDFSTILMKVCVKSLLCCSQRTEFIQKSTLSNQKTHRKNFKSLHCYEKQSWGWRYSQTRCRHTRTFTLFKGVEGVKVFIRFNEISIVSCSISIQMTVVSYKSSVR